MQAGPDSVVLFHYDLSDQAGNKLESSREREGIAVVLGHGNVIAGVEAALAQRAAGDTFQTTVRPEQAYGFRQKNLIQRVSKKHLTSKGKPKVGGFVLIKLGEDVRRAMVLKVGGSVLDVDLNHPMAGLTLVFDIEILEVRAAEPEEIAHGHVHGAGGHKH